MARVHITFPKDSVFLESREPAKASVLVKLKPGTRLLPGNVTAITHLVSSAVEGLAPGGVSVLDMQGNLLSRPQAATPDEAASEAALDYRQKLERDLLQEIYGTLDPLLGHDRYRAGVSIDCDITSGEQSEETLDPAHSVMVQSQKTEDITGSTAAGGTPGTASNLPRPAGRTSGGSTTSRRTENISYQSSRTTRTTKLPQGAVKRISIALVLDQTVRWEGAGPALHKVLTPPAPEAVKSVHDLVAAVTGLVENRGDQVTIESLPFETTLNVAPPQVDVPAVPPAAARPLNWKDWRHSPMLLPVAGGAAAALLIATVVIVVFTRSRRQGTAEAPRELPAAPEHNALQPNLTEAIEAKLAEQAAEQEKADLLALASIKVPPVKTKKTEILAKQLRQNVKKDPSSSTHVLQNWIHDRS